MNRGLVMTLCAAALAAGSLAQAQVPTVYLSLNLRYNDPFDPSEGGAWRLVGKTTAANGIAAVNAYISNIDSAGVSYGTTAGQGYTAVTGAQIAAELNNSNQPFVVAGSPVNVVYFQDTANGPVIGGVGTSVFPQRQVTDVLKNTTGALGADFTNGWNNATVLATGTFAGGGNAGNSFLRPAFASKGGNSTDANILASVGVPSNNAIDANVVLTVRGDSYRGLATPLETPVSGPGPAGLRQGDANRDGVVNIGGDGFILSANLGLPNRTWDQGDFNDSGTVTVGADGFALSANLGLAYTPPAVGAIPEPASVGLVSLGVLLVAGYSRRKN